MLCRGRWCGRICSLRARSFVQLTKIFDFKRDPEKILDTARLPQGVCHTHCGWHELSKVTEGKDYVHCDFVRRMWAWHNTPPICHGTQSFYHNRWSASDDQVKILLWFMKLINQQLHGWLRWCHPSSQPTPSLMSLLLHIKLIILFSWEQMSWHLASLGRWF